LFYFFYFFVLFLHIGMEPVMMKLRIIIMLYVTSSFEVQSLSHAQTVSEEVLGVNTWHTMLVSMLNGMQHRTALFSLVAFSPDKSHF